MQWLDFYAGFPTPALSELLTSPNFAVNGEVLKLTLTLDLEYQRDYKNYKCNIGILTQY